MTNMIFTADRITATIDDIDALMPRRCPNFLATLDATISNYFERDIDPALRDTIANAIIDRRF